MTELVQHSGGNVPVFDCRVYVRRLESGQTRARVANLEGIEAVAADERGALMRIVPQIKTYLSQQIAEGKSIQWKTPPLAREENEQERAIPVHL